jgi:hypothetical protein
MQHREWPVKPLSEAFSRMTRHQQQSQPKQLETRGKKRGEQKVTKRNRFQNTPELIVRPFKAWMSAEDEGANRSTVDVIFFSLSVMVAISRLCLS